MLKRLDTAINQWFTIPEENAAGNLGIFRIVWSILVLCMALATFQEEIVQLPLAQWYPVQALIWLKAPPPAALITLMTIVRICAVVFVLFGYRTRLSTFIVFVVALFLEGLTFSFGKHEHNDTVAYIYIPMIMMLYNWGQTYSLDAILRQRAGKSVPDVSDGSWQHGWPLKLILVILSVLYFGAFYIKVARIEWVTDPQHLRNLLYGRYITSPNLLRHWVVSSFIVVFFMQIATLLFEGLFFVSLFNKTWRTLFLSAGVFFHLSIYLIMGPPFHQLVFVYAIFLNWQQIGEWVGIPNLFERLKRVSPTRLIAMPISVALVAALLRLFILPPNTLSVIEPTWIAIIWVSGVLIAIVGFIHAIPRLLGQILTRFNLRESTQT